MLKLIKKTVIEILIVSVFTGLIALGINTVHPDGIDLNRNYFKAVPKKAAKPQPKPAPPHVVNPDPNTLEPNQPATTSAPKQPEQNTQTDHGLNKADFDFILGAWNALQAGEETIIFVDARNAKNYKDGHIPGAILIDHYRLDRYLPQVKDKLKAAQILILYCTGSCEDSRYLATTLIYEHGFEPHKLYLYEGGMSDWTQRQQPITQGDQP